MLASRTARLTCFPEAARTSKPKRRESAFWPRDDIAGVVLSFAAPWQAAEKCQNLFLRAKC